MIADGRVRAVDVVRDELGRRDDETHSWARAHSDLFVPLDQDIQSAAKQILLAHPAMADTGADPFVVGLALARTGTVVTDQTFSGNLDRPRIPDVCAAISVPCVHLMGFVQAQRWTF